MRRATVKPHDALTRLCLAALLLLVPVTATSAGMDCAKAVSAVEKRICADPALLRADGEVAQAFAEALAASPDAGAVRAAQRQWLARRNACPDAACLAQSHAQRLRELRALAAGTAGRDAAERARLRAVLGWPEDCEQAFRELTAPDRNGTGSVGPGVEAHDLGDGRTLYCVLCDQAAYQSVFVVMLQETPGGPGTLLRFPLYDRDGARVSRSEDTSLAGLPDFDATKKTLSVLYKARGLGDCGSHVVYAFPRQGAPTVLEARAKGCSDRPTRRDADIARWPLVKTP